MTDLLELAKRCEDIKRGSGHLDYLIWQALGLRGDIDYYTSSLDAAMTLVPAGHVFTVSDWYNGNDERLPQFADCVPRNGDEFGDVQQAWANSKPLALCSAALQAHHALTNITVD